MAGAFKPGSSLTRDQHDWGVFAQVSGPRDGLDGIVAIEATFLPGKCHDFHRHPGPGRGDLRDRGHDRAVGPGGEAGAHGGRLGRDPGLGASTRSFNDGTEPAKILAILSPAVGDDGYGVEDVAGDEPWASLR